MRWCLLISPYFQPLQISCWSDTQPTSTKFSESVSWTSQNSCRLPTRVTNCPQHYFHPNLANGHRTMLIWSTWSISQFCERRTCWFRKFEKLWPTFLPANQIFVNYTLIRSQIWNSNSNVNFVLFYNFIRKCKLRVLYMQIFWAMHWCVH